MRTRNITVPKDLLDKFRKVQGKILQIPGVDLVPPRNQKKWGAVIRIPTGPGPKAAIRNLLARVGLRLSKQVASTNRCSGFHSCCCACDGCRVDHRWLAVGTIQDKLDRLKADVKSAPATRVLKARSRLKAFQDQWTI